MRIIVEAVPALSSRRRWEKTDAFVVADGLDVDAGMLRQITDRKVYGSRICVWSSHGKVLEPVVATGINFSRCQTQCNQLIPRRTLSRATSVSCLSLAWS